MPLPNLSDYRGRLLWEGEWEEAAVEVMTRDSADRPKTIDLYYPAIR